MLPDSDFFRAKAEFSIYWEIIKVNLLSYFGCMAGLDNSIYSWSKWPYALSLIHTILFLVTL